MDNKQSAVSEHRNQLRNVKKELCSIISCLDYLFTTSLFLERNVKIAKQIESTQNTKLSKILEENPKHSAKDLIYNFSSRSLTSSQEAILMKGLNYALPPKKLIYEDYLLNFELFFRSTTAAKNCKDRELANFKSELKNLGFSSLKYYNRRKKKLVNITAEEHRALNELLSYDDIIIQKSDKGNVIVIVNRVSYVEKMEGILSDNSKFTPKHFSNDHDDLKYILENEKKLKDFLSNLVEKGSITSEEFGKLCPRGNKPGIFYGL